MILKKIKSPKHKGAIFLKVQGTRDDFFCKIYPSPHAENRADAIRFLYANNEEKEILRKELNQRESKQY